jgi:hypothetical protein
MERFQVTLKYKAAVLHAPISPLVVEAIQAGELRGVTL